MGLLDDLLGGLTGPGTGSRAQQRPAQAGARGTDMKRVLIALMPIVLGMLSNRGRHAGARDRMDTGPGAGGGLADVLGQALGRAGERGGSGGLGGLLEQLQRAGFGEQADSWVSRGANKPIPP